MTGLIQAIPLDVLQLGLQASGDLIELEHPSGLSHMTGALVERARRPVTARTLGQLGVLCFPV